jgi:hypothetical protein
LALAAAALLFARGAKADPLCGHSFESLPQLYVSIRDAKSGSWFFAERVDGYVVATGDALWVFARDFLPEFPAALCRRWITTGNQTRTEVEYRCEGAKAACDTFVARFSSNDWTRR